jgi:hypothetical protein
MGMMSRLFMIALFMMLCSFTVVLDGLLQVISGLMVMLCSTSPIHCFPSGLNSKIVVRAHASPGLDTTVSGDVFRLICYIYETTNSG